MAHIGIGLQMYTLREETKADFIGTLRKVAELGYEGVEFAGYGGVSAEDMKALLQELGMKAVGSHVGLQALRDNLQGEIDYVKTIGGQYLICPFMPAELRQDAEGWKAVFRELEEIGCKVREAGIGFAYHNHAFEFEMKVDGEYAFDAMYTQTSPEKLLVEMDSCWVQVGGENPADYVRKYSGRLPLVHVKDYGEIDAEKKDTKELGTGEIDLSGVIEASLASGVEWLIVEQDRCHQHSPLESVGNSIRWLQNALGR